MLNKLTLRQKLLITFILLFMLTGILGTFGLSALFRSNQIAQEIYDQGLVRIKLLGDATSEALRIQETLRAFLTTQTIAERIRQEERLAASEAQFQSIIDEYARQPQHRGGQLALNDFHQEWDDFLTTSEEIVRLARSGNRAAASKILNEEAGQALQQAIDYLLLLQDIEDNVYREEFLEGRAALDQIVTLSAILTGVILVFSLGAAFWLSQNTATPMIRMAEVADKIAAGQLSERVATDQPGPELGTLAQAFNSMTSQLQQLLSGLEARVAERTRSLELSTQVSQSLSRILETDVLVREIVEQIQQAFQYYHVHIYLLDDAGENLLMAGGTGQAGQIMLANGHKIVAGRGLVGRAASTNMPVLIKDVSQSPDWLSNPLLPETKAEIAVPIAVGGNVLGVLDVQHNIAEGLTEADVDLLQSLAYQIAISLQNARQYAEVQQRTREIQESTTFLDSVLENLPNMLFVKDADDLRFVRFNKAGEELVGIGREQFLGRNDYDFFPVEEAEFFVAKDREVLAGQVLVDIPEEPIHTEHQGTRILHTRKVPIMGTDGKPQYLLGISEDITEQKRIEAQLESRIVQLNLLSEIGRKAENTNSIAEFLQWMSERLVTAVQYPEACLVAIALDDEIYGDEQAIHLPHQIVEGLRIQGNLIGQIYLAYDADHNFGDEESALLGSISQRVSNYIETQRLTERTRLLASIVENHPDFIGVGSLEGKALYVNPAGLQMMGYPSEHDMQSMDTTDFYPPDDADRLLNKGIPAALTSGSWTDEAQVVRTDGTYLPVEETIGVNYDAAGHPVSFSITMRDITERKQTAETLARQAKELQIVTEVGTAAAAANDASQLLQTVVDLTQSGFGLSYVQIFLLDTFADELRMAAGSGETGQYLMQENPHVPLRSAKSLIAQAARERQGIVASDVREVMGYLSHPLLADTRSEIAVPLVSGNVFLGILDVQSDKLGYFAASDLPVFITLGTQVAVALQNVRQYEETQRALAEVQSLQRIMTREGWQTFMMAQERPVRGYHAHQNKVEVISANEDPKAEVTTPVTVLGQAIGHLAVRGNVSAENKALLEAISQQIGQALERTRLTEQTQLALSETEQQARRLGQLNDMAAAISAATTLEDVLQVAVERTNIIFSGQRASLALLDERSNMLQVYALSGDAGAIDTGTRLPLVGTAVGTATQENHSIVLNDLTQSSYKDVKQLYASGMRSVMSVPLTTSRTIGTLNIASSKPHAFSQNDESLLVQVASLVATTIESRRLFLEVEDRAEELAVINQVAQAVSQQLEANQLLETVFGSVRQVMEVDAFMVSTYEAATNMLSYPILYDHEQYYQVAPAPLNSNSQSYQVVHTGQSLLNNHTPEELEMIKQQAPATLGKTDAYPASSMFVPLKIGQQVTGILSVQSYNFNAYSEVDMAVLTGIANHVAVALENARLFTEARRRADRERLVNEITRKIQGTTSMESALQTAVRELGSALQVKNAQVALHPATKPDRNQQPTNGPTQQTITAD